MRLRLGRDSRLRYFNHGVFMFATPYKIVITRHVKRVTAHVSCLLLFLTTTIWMWHTTGIANRLSLSPAVLSSSDLSAASGNDFKPDHNGKYWIYGDGIWAAFIPYGASISDLIIKDRYGVSRDIVVGYDNATAYVEDKSHPHLGGVPGRYANRIRNSTFVMDGQKYLVAPNENPTSNYPEGVDTLHGGPDGWDWRNFTIVSHTNSSITFSLVDPDGKEGFPGEVVSKITYTLDGMDWNIKMVAQPTTHKTPIMLTSHTYWNLDGFANNETHTALNHTLHLPYSDQRIGVDNILIPDGTILPNSNGSVNDFWSKPKHIGVQLDNPELVNNCGFNCKGYGNPSRDYLSFTFIVIDDFR